MRNHRFHSWFAGLLIILFLTGCRSGDRNTSKLIGDMDTAGQDAGLESFSQIYHLYPSPGEMLGIIDMAEMSYDGDLLLPVSRADRYLDTRSKTYILGVYMTDLAYAALFGRHEATLDYLEAVRAISEEIRISEAVDDRMVEKARDNVGQLDSLYSISNEAFMNVLAFCDRNHRSNTVVMMSAGAFAESLYLAVNLIEDYEQADFLLQHLADQKYSIDNFMAFAENVKGDDEHVTATIEDLRRIEEIYEGIDPGPGEVSVTPGPPGEGTDGGQPKRLVIGGDSQEDQPGLTRDEFEALREAVVELRAKMVDGQ